MNAVPSTIADIYRLLQNLIRQGAVEEVDYGSETAPARVRIRSGQNVTEWLAWCTQRAGTTRTWNPPTIGEQVVLLCPGGDLAAAIVLLGIPSDANPAPSSAPNEALTQYPDGAVVRYDHEAHHLDVDLPAGATARVRAPVRVEVVSEHIMLDAPTTDITGACNVLGLFTYSSGMAGSGDAGNGNAAAIQGTVHVTDDVIANGVSVVGHDHGGVERGGGRTDPPGATA